MMFCDGGVRISIVFRQSQKQESTIYDHNHIRKNWPYDAVAFKPHFDSKKQDCTPGCALKWFKNQHGEGMNGDEHMARLIDTNLI